LQHIHGAAWTKKLVLAFAAIFVVAALLVPVTHFSDLPSYVNRGWEQYRYALNPYVHPVADVPGWQRDPMIVPKWLSNPCPYGFIYALLCRAVAAAGHGSQILTIYLFKLLNLIAYAAVAWLIVATRRRLRIPDDHAVLYLFLWNPLIVMEVVAHAHNDILMALCTLLAIFAASCEAWTLVLPLLTTGALIKYSSAVMIPFAVIEMNRRGKCAAIVRGGTISIALFFLSGAPYLGAIKNFQARAGLTNLLITANSLESMLLYLYEIAIKPVPAWRWTIPIAHDVLLALIWTAGLMVLSFQLLMFRRRSDGGTMEFIVNALFAQFVVVCVLSSKFYSWYVPGFFPLALVLHRDHWLRKLIVLISLTEMFGFTPLEQAHIINYLVMVLGPILWIACQDSRVTQTGISY
jgi:hypothetical protein